MKNWIFYAIICLGTLSCQRQVSAADIAKINGYWEIEKVVFPDGSKKDYTSSTVYDYIEVKNDKGFRKKVTPQLDGTFLVDDSSEQLSLTQKEGVYMIHYLTAYAKWDEELVSVSDEQFITRNNSKKEYYYKRAQSINLLPDGKKAQ